MGLLYGENFIILTQTDGRAIAYTRYSIYALARKNDFYIFIPGDLYV